ncbi:MAG: hypothetical protein IKL79_03680 [Clostridia bacterium]|nr:hypothetical protein [Clostridia bacterium]
MQNAFFAAENTIKNLSRISERTATLTELRILELHDMASALVTYARALASDGLFGYEILSAVRTDEKITATPSTEGTPAELKSPLNRSLSLLSGIDRAVLSDLFVAGARECRLPVLEADLLSEGEGEETFIYLRNSLSDEAYDVFSSELDAPRVKYAATLNECARATEAGEVRFCLLPLEERGGSRLPTVSELIYRFDLKINAVTPVFGFDGTADLKYAMLSRDFVIPECGDGDDRYMELRISADDPVIGELFTAVSYFGHTLYRTDTVSFDTEGERDRFFSLVIRDGGEGFAPLLVYLSLFAEDFTPVGIYKNLE